MSGIRNPSFPTTSDARVNLSKLARKNFEAGPPPRGPDGLRPGVIQFPWITLLNLVAYQPVACIATSDPVENDGNPCMVNVDGLDRVSFWLVDMQYAETGEQPFTPPQITFEIRPATAGVSDIALSGQTHFVSYQDKSMLAEVSGWLCSQWELWARINPLEPSDAKLRILVAGAADRMGGGSLTSQFGLVAHAFP